MLPLNHSPASVRYLKARLRILKRPAVWGSAAILLLTLFSVYTFLQRPDWLTVSESERVSPEAENAADDVDPNALPPEEDSAIGMDIDSLSVLRNEISNFDEEAEIDLLTPPSGSSDELEDGESAALPQTGSPLVSGAPQSSQSSQFSSAYAQNDRPLSLNLFNTPTVLPGSLSTADASAEAPGSSLGLGTTPQATPPANPLRSAVEQYANSANQSNAQAQAQAPAQPTEAASEDSRRQPAATPTYLPPQSLGQFAPQTSPTPGTTGYTIPPSLIYGRNSTYNNPVNPNPSGQAIPGLPQAPQVLPQTIPTQPGIGQVQTPYGTGAGGGVSPVPNVQQPQVVQPPPQPFSVPRSSAGYSIGGREIETFSNP